MNNNKLNAIREIKSLAVKHNITLIDLIESNPSEGMSKRLLKMKKRHDKAEGKGKGEKVKCPVCRKKFKKKASNSIYCSSKGSGNCRDEYHNLMNPARIGARK